MNLSLPTAFIAGLLSFLSPCVLPLVPGYVSLISGISVEKLKEGGAGSSRAVLLGALAFSLGFSAVFISMGAAASSVGAFLLKNKALLFKIAGVIIVFFGLFLLGVIKIESLYREKRFHEAGGRGPLGSFVLGLAFAFGWTPCIGPILGAILALAATRDTIGQGVSLLAVYSAGLAIPFLLTAVGFDRFLAFSKGFRRHLVWVERTAGVLLIIVGLLIFSGQLTRLSGYFAFLNKIEQSLVRGDPVAQASATNLLEPLPDLTLPDRTGTPVRLRDLKGKVVVINFWATWCLPCKLEIPFFNKVYDEYRARGVEFIGLSVDVGGWKDIEQFEKEVPIGYQVLLADEKDQAAFGGILGLPTTLYVDRQGRIAYKYIGITDIDQLRAMIARLL